MKYALCFAALIVLFWPAPPQRPTAVAITASSHVGGRTDGATELQDDLPGRMHQKNTGGRDGAGLCVFASMRHTGLWQDDPAFAGLFEYMKSQPGGGYPEKVDQMLKQFCAQKGIPVPNYVQIQNGDLELLRLACKNGLMPGVTYDYSPTGRYGGQRISHMVSLVHADDQYFVVLDNNYPGDTNYEWDTVQDFSYVHGPHGWSIILLRKSPPPPPRN